MKAHCVVCGKGFEKRGNRKACSKECSARRRIEQVCKYRTANTDKIRERNHEANRKYRAANPEKCRQMDRERRRKYYVANPEKLREKNRKYYAARKARDERTA